MSKVDVLLGLQWGDEGKGKIVDVLAPKYDVVARFQGGPNAGHTLEFDGIKHVLHQIPSGIFREKTKNIIGNGVVLDPVIFKAEIEKLKKYNLNVKANLFISKKATLIFPRTGYWIRHMRRQKVIIRLDRHSKALDRLIRIRSDGKG